MPGQESPYVIGYQQPRPCRVDVFKRPTQRAEQRFGQIFDAAALEPMVGNSYDNGCFKDLPDALPQFESWRMNLTAFSQCYNLYFVAIRNQMYVYRPRNLDQAIPGKPDVVIRPPPITGLPKPRSIFPDHPHCINSFIIGDFGNLEILLIAFDDGDVYAYYTKDIEAIVQSRKIDRNQSTLAEIKPFLRDNVRDSAWGLAIHKDLRLIAVSSNDHRITFFYFALNDEHFSYEPQTANEEKSMEPVVLSCDCLHGHEVTLLAGNSRPPDFLRTQAKNDQAYFWPGWGNNVRPTLNMEANGLESNNIPMLAFSSSAPISPRSAVLIAQDIFGKVFVITFSELPRRYTLTVHQALGFKTREDEIGTHFVTGWAVAILEPDFFLADPKSPLHKISPAILCTSKESVAHWPIDYPERAASTIRAPHLLPGRINAGVLASGRCQDKLSLLLKVPELNLVVVGSPIGTVVLFTAICCAYSPDPSQPVGDLHEFSCGIVLPTFAEQADGHRPRAVLVGIAVAPIQEEENELKKATVMKPLHSDPESTDFGLPSKRFRLLLHYEDHTILTYELSKAREGSLMTPPDIHWRIMAQRRRLPNLM